MIPREIATEFQTLLTEYPVVTLLGPRQSGKTTLAQSICHEAAYANLEKNEVDLLALEGRQIHALEIKSCSTFHPGLLKSLTHIKKHISPDHLTTHLVYNGHPHQRSDGTQALHFRQAAPQIFSQNKTPPP